MCRRTEEKVRPTVGFPYHRHFVGFFNVTVQAPIRGHPFPVIPRNCRISVAHTTRKGIRRTHSRVKTGGGGGSDTENSLFACTDHYVTCVHDSYDMALCFCIKGV